MSIAERVLRQAGMQGGAPAPAPVGGEMDEALTVAYQEAWEAMKIGDQQAFAEALDSATEIKLASR